VQNPKNARNNSQFQMSHSTHALQPFLTQTRPFNQARKDNYVIDKTQSSMGDEVEFPQGSKGLIDVSAAVIKKISNNFQFSITNSFHQTEVPP